MSGGGGGRIIIDVVSKTLGDPIVHGQLPTNLQKIVDPVLAKPEDQWTDADKVIAGHVLVWALTNLQ